MAPVALDPEPVATPAQTFKQDLSNLPKNPLERTYRGNKAGTIHMEGIPQFDDPYKKREWVKEQLAVGFQYWGKEGYAEGLSGHITVRDPVWPDHYWMNPIGVHFSAITISNLVLVSPDGYVHPDGAQLPINQAGIMIHSAIHKARPEVQVAAHCHSLHGKAWSVFGKPIDIMTQDGCLFYDNLAVYKNFGGIVLAPEEGKNIADALGPTKMAAILQNHGLLTLGMESVAEAVYYFQNLERLCKVQLLVEAAAANGLEKRIIDDEDAAFTAATLKNPHNIYANFRPEMELLKMERGHLFLKWRECTFLLPPPARPKKDPSAPADSSSSTFLPSTFAPPVFQTSPHDLDSRITAAATATLRASKRPSEDLPSEPARKRIAPSGSHAGLASLDRDLPVGVEPCAVTATLTDDLLTHQTVGTSRQISSDRNRSQFILFHAIPPHRPLSSDFEAGLLRRIRSFLAVAVPSRSEDALLEHYLSNLHPVRPLLPVSTHHSLDNLPPSLRAVILVDALSSFPEHKAASVHAWRLLKEERAGDRMLDMPKLSSLATAVLELSTTLDPRGDYGLLAKTIAHAQLLGLHVDCRAWAIPEWEKSLRDRIWWSLRIHDAWASFLNSRPSHIQAGNTNVPLLPFPTPADDVEAYVGSISFGYACRLAVVVSRLQLEVSTLDRYGSAARADSCDHLEQELNAMKEGARPFLEMSSRPVGMECFLFSLLALRCMVRRISIEVRIGLGNAFAPDGSTLQIFAELVEHFSTLTEESFGSTQAWMPYTSHILSSVLSSLIRLSLAAISSKHSTPPPTARPAIPSHHPTPPLPPSSTAILLLARLSSLVHRARHDWGWALADAALNRAANVADRLSAAMQADAAGEDYREVVAALRREALPEPGPYAAPTAPAVADTSFEALNALATLAERPGEAAGAMLGGEATSAAAGEVDPSFDAGLAIFGGGAGIQGTSTEGEGLAFEQFDLPDLEEWLNVLDHAPAWGFDGSPPGGGISW
ncbi:hypothetical protein JCM10450v2_000945 [Rhodotorula kratochvilovae]